jgi:hypothetical protein
MGRGIPYAGRRQRRFGGGQVSTTIACPHCKGTGYRREDEDESACVVCTGLACPRGYLLLPLSPRYADRIYTAGCLCCESLVGQPWDDEMALYGCTDCSPLRTCDECYRVSQW